MKAVLISLLAPLVAFAQTDPFSGEGMFGESSPVNASLVTDATTIAPGQPFQVALVLKHAPHWHTYYVNPGQVGFPPSIEWTLPEGFTAGELQFPTPIVGTFADSPFYGYEGETWFLTTLTAPQSLKTGEPVTLTANASWLACNTGCIPGDAELTVELSTADEAVKNQETAEGFASAGEALPSEPASWTIQASGEGDTITIDLSSKAGAVEDPGEVHFFSSNSLEDASKPQQLTKTEGGFQLTFPRHPETDPAPATVEGILRASKGWSQGSPSKGLAVSTPLGAPAGASDPVSDNNTATSEGSLALPAILGLMFVGGLILNLMPCVFPVIGLKIMGFVQQAGHSKTKVISHGLTFTLGVLVSFWILAGILLAGGIANWGGQLENPWVVFILMLVMLIFGLSMYGVFEIGTSATGVGGKLSNKEGLSGTFFSGVLATVVATPCSAPFLGTGIGAAVALPAPLFMLAFTFMALGLSVPYLVLSFFPSLVDKLPRPGPWMESFKQGMAFLLFGTAGFLLWVYSAQTFDQLSGQKGIYVMLGLTAIAAAFWVYGRWSLPHRSATARTVGRLTAALMLVAGFVAAMPGATPSAEEIAAPAIEWEKWTKDKETRLIAEGKPVFIDFTARWCLTCQTNKSAAYTDEIVQLFQDHGIVALKADKTTTRPDIDAELRRLGKSAIPVNILYHSGSEQPHITNTILTAPYLKGFLEEQLGKPAEPVN